MVSRSNSPNAMDTDQRPFHRAERTPIQRALGESARSSSSQSASGTSGAVSMSSSPARSVLNQQGITGDGSSTSRSAQGGVFPLYNLPSRSHHLPASPSNTSQSEEGDDDDDDEEEDEDDEPSSSYIFAGPETGPNGPAARIATSREALGQLERRNTITSRQGPYMNENSEASTSRSSLHRSKAGPSGTPGSATISEGDMWGSYDPHSMASSSPANLPHEIMLHIFKYVVSNPGDLRTCLQVCKSWCLGGVELLWHRPTFSKASSFYKMTYTLSLHNPTFEYATFIRRLNFSALGAELDNASFERIASCTRLERLTLAGCGKLTDEKLSSVLENTKELVAIDLTDVKGLRDPTIMTLVKGCSKLQGINLSGCSEISSSSVAALARNCKMLRRIKLYKCAAIEDDAVTALAENCPLLLEVDLTECKKVTDAGVRQLWQRSSHLREFRLALCGNLIEHGRHVNNLTDAGFPAPTSGQVRDSRNTVMSNGIIRAPPRSDLRDMDTDDKSGKGSDAQLLLRGIGVSPAKMFDHLRILDLGNCAHITDDAIEGIINNAPKLRNLILAKCSSLTDESVYSISRLGKNLHYLHLGRVDR